MARQESAPLCSRCELSLSMAKLARYPDNSGCTMVLDQKTSPVDIIGLCTQTREIRSFTVLRP